MRLTILQADAMEALSNYAGRTVQVRTSHYDANLPASFKPVTYCNSAALRGLERKGLIKIERAYWKGADVTVLRAA